MDLTTYYNKNIDTLNQFCDKYNIPRDYVSDTYLKIKDVLIKSGLTEQQYFNFIRKTIWNRHIDEKRRPSFKYVKDIHYHTKYCDNISSNAFFEAAKREQDDWDSQSQRYYEELEYLTRNLFKYIEKHKNYNEIEIFIFKAYCISGYTYREMEDKFGLRQTRCKETMRKFRKDIRNNFINYIENGETQ